jgi:carbon monoxide dehydrogenase subunit G
VNVNGEATLHGPVDRVYKVLHDPAVLVRTIPGCERLEQVGPDAYRMVVSAGVAAIKGTYSGDVELTEQEAPNSFLLKASGSGAPGTVSAEVRIRLAAQNGGTLLTYDADAVVGGPVGGVGQRILAGVAKKTAGEFFAAVDDVLTGAAVAAVAVPEAPAAPGVFIAPPRVRAPHGGDFVTGVVVGAAAALLGAIVGGLIARRPGR